LTYNCRDKINAFHITGRIGYAAIVAGLPLFIITAGALIDTSLFAGEIRVPKRPLDRKLCR